MDTHLPSVADLVTRIVETEGVPGAGIAVLAGGEVVLDHVVGEASPGVAAGPDTLWPIASITKLYTAAAIVRLLEHGQLALSTPVGSVVPSFTGDGKEQVQLRHLLTHTAGLAYEPPDMAQLLANGASLVEIVDWGCALPLEYAPGTDQHYSDLGYALAGRVAEIVMGVPFPDLVRELVLHPAGLTTTHFPAPHEASRIATVLGATDEDTPSAMYYSAHARSLAHPAFGVVATLSDLLRFGACLTPHAQPLLSRAGLTAMTTDQTGSDEPGVHVTPPVGVIHPWGIGCIIKGRGTWMELVSPTSYGHLGASGCVLWIDPTVDVVVAFVSNRHSRLDPDGFMPRLRRIVNAAVAAVTG